MTALVRLPRDHGIIPAHLQAHEVDGELGATAQRDLKDFVGVKCAEVVRVGAGDAHRADHFLASKVTRGIDSQRAIIKGKLE